MTRKGPKARRLSADDPAYNTKWKKHDVILRREDDSGEEELVLYKIVAVSADHEFVADDAMISCQMFCTRGTTHTLTDMVWNNFKALELTDVDAKLFKITKGTRRTCAASKLVIKINVQEYYDRRQCANVQDGDGAWGEAEGDDGDVGEANNADDGGEVKDDEGGGKVKDKLSMEAVAMSLPDFKNVKSMLQTLVERRGHLLQLSPKYHAELAGQGIEYDFGRTKWWFRNHNSHSTAGLREKSKQSFGPDVVTIAHTRKFARRARDYQRAYRVGHTGLEVEVGIKKYKCHRAAIDTDFTFCRENVVA